MPVYRFEAVAYEEWDFDAETYEDAEHQASKAWDERFRGMFGGPEYMKEIEGVEE